MTSPYLPGTSGIKLSERDGEWPRIRKKTVANATGRILNDEFLIGLIKSLS